MEREKTALGRKVALEKPRIREEERRAAMVMLMEGEDVCCRCGLAVGVADLPGSQSLLL